MDLNEIKSFVYIVENGSLTKASKILSIPKSTLSRHLQNLENRLGITLINRSTRKISLTQSGEIYFKHCSMSLQSLLESEKELLDYNNSLNGKIKITAPVDIGTYSLGRIISEFLKKYPKIEIDLVLTDRIVDMISEGFDIALRPGKVTASGLKFKRLTQQNFICVASPKYIQENNLPLTPEDLKKHRCWFFSGMKKPLEWRLVTPQKHTKTIKFNKSFKFFSNSLQSIKILTTEDAGIGFLPSFLVKDSILSGELLHILPNWSSETGYLNICYPENKKTPHRVRLLIDHLIANIK